MRERLVRGPRLDDNVEAFVKARAGLVHIDAKAAKLIVAITAADAEIEPAAGKQVERRRLFGEQYRIVPGQHDDRRAEAQCAGARAKPGEQVQRRRNLAIAREVVFDDKGRTKTECLRLDIVFDEIAEPLGAVELSGICTGGAPRRRVAEQPELHECAPSPSRAADYGEPLRCSKCLMIIAVITEWHVWRRGPKPVASTGACILKKLPENR